MKHLGVEVLSDCKSDCLTIFNQARQLRGKSKQSIFDSPEFGNIKRKVLSRKPDVSDRDVLAFVLRKAATFLRES
jgi:hypothetical protein